MTTRLLWKAGATTTATYTVRNAAGAPVTAATTARITLRDALGATVAGETWPKALSHDGNGVWSTTLPGTVAIQVGVPYVLTAEFADASTTLTQTDHVWGVL